MKFSQPIDAKLEELAKSLHANETTLTTAESCTGGLLAAALVSHPGLSGAFERGLVVYSVDAKCELLGLERRHVEECEGVSADIARAMAQAALDESHAQLSAAITGFAGPRQGEEEVGLVYVAVATAEGCDHRELHCGDIGREAVCEQVVLTALQMMIDRIDAAAPPG